VANSTAFSLSMGSAPGRPMQTGTDVGIGLSAELVGATAEDLGGGEQLDVHFKPDHGLIFGQDFWRESGSGAHSQILARLTKPGRHGAKRYNPH